MTDQLTYEINLQLQDANRKLDQLFRGQSRKAGAEGKQAGRAFGDSFRDTVQGILATISFGGLTNLVKRTTDAAVSEERALKSLAFVAPRFGQDAEQAEKAARRLADELKIGVAPAAASLQNLFKSGLDIEQSEELLKRFTNEAVNGKADTIELAQAVENLSFAYATNNSALGNLSGINENFSDIIADGASLIDEYKDGTIDLGDRTEEVTKQIQDYEDRLKKQGKQLDSTQEEQAKLIGTLSLTNLTLGAADDAFEGIIGTQADFDLQVKELERSIGRALLPALSDLLDILSPIIENITNFISKNPELATVVTGASLAVAGLGTALFFLKPIFSFLVGAFKQAIPAIKILKIAIAFLINPITVLAIAIAALVTIFALNWDKIKVIVSAAVDGINRTFTNFLNSVDRIFRGVFDSIVGFFRDTWDESGRLLSNFIDSFGRAWEGLGRNFREAFDGIGSGAAGLFKSAVNAIITQINRAISVLNSFINDVKNTVNQIPGVNIDIPRVPKVPKLASGAFVDKPTLAVVGEAGSEAVLNNQAVQRLGLTKSIVDSINAGGTVNNNQNNSRNLTVNNFGGFGQREFDNISLAF